MSGATIDSSSMPFGPYATSFDASQLQTYPDLSPMSIFDTEDFGTDLASDSAASPISPLSPALSTNSFGFPTTDMWANWDAAELSSEPDNLFECQTFASCPPSNAPFSPAINPINLTVPASANTQPLPFQAPQIMLASASMPSKQRPSVPMMAALPTPPTSSTTSPTTNPAAKRYPSRALKRKSTSGPSDEEPAAKSTAVSPSPGATTTTTTTAHRPSTSKTKHAPALGPNKSAHNMIEKRYRTNINDKIAQLRDAVPSLRLMAQRAKAAEDGDGLLESVPGLAAPGQCAKPNKATILSKATEYIHQLERRSQGLEAENSALRGRMEALEIMLTGSGHVAGGWN